MMMQKKYPLVWFITLGFALAKAPIVGGSESIWIEAEQLQGIRGSCFPDLGRVTAAGAWGLLGPGIAPEWLSIACGPNDDKAKATYDFEVPECMEKDMSPVVP